jgi:dephospho-CoA kinase
MFSIHMSIDQNVAFKRLMAKCQGNNLSISQILFSARRKLNSELSRVRHDLIQQTSGKKGDLMKLELQVKRLHQQLSKTNN